MKTLTLEQVLHARRQATSESWVMYFNLDGTLTLVARRSFMVPGVETWGAAVVATLQRDGWQHDDGCDCEFCRP